VQENLHHSLCLVSASSNSESHTPERAKERENKSNNHFNRQKPQEKSLLSSKKGAILHGGQLKEAKRSPPTLCAPLQSLWEGVWQCQHEERSSKTVHSIKRLANIVWEVNLNIAPTKRGSCEISAPSLPRPRVAESSGRTPCVLNIYR
jgi:hypothetical protein